jgi:hypothetical protein
MPFIQHRGEKVKLTRYQQKLCDVMRAHGIVHPEKTLEAADAAGIHLRYACALLENESGGGTQHLRGRPRRHGTPCEVARRQGDVVEVPLLSRP